jgi:hypothetical protein
MTSTPVEERAAYPHGTQTAFPAGQRLSCSVCGAEIEIIKPSAAQPPDQVLRCCGKEMRPAS